MIIIFFNVSRKQMVNHLQMLIVHSLLRMLW